MESGGEACDNNIKVVMMLLLLLMLFCLSMMSRYWYEQANITITVYIKETELLS